MVLVGGLAVLGGVLSFVIVTFVRGVPALAAQLSTSVDTAVGWLATGPLQLSAAQLAGVHTQILDTLSAHQATITSGALATAATLGGRATVPTLDGPEEVTLDAGTQPGESVTLRGRGMPILRRPGRNGDLPAQTSICGEQSRSLLRRDVGSTYRSICSTR